MKFVPVSTSPGAALRVLTSLELPGTVCLGQVGEPVRRLATGIPHLDTVLEGGLPRGRLSELVGPVSAGKTSILLTFLAAATQRGEVAALIDIADALHPVTAQAAGVELTHLLWVRPPSFPDGLRCAELILEAGGFGFIAVDLGTPHPQYLRMPVWPRLSRAVERAGAAVAIVAPRRITGSFAAVSLAITAHNRQWSHGAWPLFEGIHLQLAVVRNKLGTPGRHVVIRARASRSVSLSSTCHTSGSPLRARNTNTIHDHHAPRLSVRS